MKHFKGILFLIVLAIAFTIPGSVLAEYPEKPISYIIPFVPGGESDITARHQQSFFKEKFGQIRKRSNRPQKNPCIQRHDGQVNPKRHFLPPHCSAQPFLVNHNRGGYVRDLFHRRTCQFWQPSPGKGGECFDKLPLCFCKYCVKH